MGPFSTIGIFGKRGDERAAQTLRQLAHLLTARADATHPVTVLVASDSASDLNGGAPPEGVQIVSPETLAERCQLAVVVGGDGTLLSAARSLVTSGTPILGINHGRLGFLVEVGPEAMADAISAVLRGDAQIEERLLLSARVRRAGGSTSPELLAVNDVVVRNVAAIRMIEFETWLSVDSATDNAEENPDGGWEYISSHRADGLIASTPTGSTAYALSGGGPVLHPDLSAVALVPICPHTLTDRPIAVPANRAIRIALRNAAGGGANMTCDGQIGMPLATGDEIRIVRSPHHMRLIHPQGYSYFKMLRDKLLWGRGPERDRT